MPVPTTYPNHAHQGTVRCSTCGGLECLCRPRFFAGQLLTENDLQALDHYIIEKNKLHNRYLHGNGVVCGLEVLCHECKGWILIKQGYAIDPCGNDIIVCKDYPVDLCAKISECCKPDRQDWDCEPITTTPPDCKEIEQCWYITLRYQESQSRGITALKSPRPDACCDRCSCGSSSHNGCRCSCHTNGHKPASTSVCRPTRGALPQCEPTRICEGFTVEIAPAPPRPREESPLAMFEGTLLASVFECAQAVAALKPNLTGINDAQKLQQACCLYKKAVWDFLKNHPLTRCEMLVRVAELQCPLLASPTGAALDLTPITNTIAALDALLDEFLRQCVCLAFLPPCPGDASDARVILACVTVRRDETGCRIIDICHWHGRKFVWTWPNVFYWLPVGALYKQVLENACCKATREAPPPPTPPSPTPPIL